MKYNHSMIMNFFVIFSAVLALSYAGEIPTNRLEYPLDRELVNEFLEKYEEKLKSEDTGEITAVLNEYADKLFDHLETYAVANGLDPVAMNDMVESFLGSSISLTEGKLRGVSSVNRYDDVKVSYQHSLKKLDMEFPIVFSNLNFTYHYHVVLFLVGPQGDMTGKIKDFRTFVKFNFDFNTYTASIERIQTVHSGEISLTFEGNALTDVIINILSQFVSTILHPILNIIIETIIKSVANKIVTDINQVIDHILHPNSTNVVNYMDSFVQNYHIK